MGAITRHTHMFVCLLPSINNDCGMPDWFDHQNFFFVLISNPAVDNRCVCVHLISFYSTFLILWLQYACLFENLMVSWFFFCFMTIIRFDRFWLLIELNQFGNHFSKQLHLNFFFFVFFSGVIRFIHSRQTKTIPGIYDYNMIIYR